MASHSEIVTEYYLAAKNKQEEAWYDDVFREEPYFENENTPLSKKTDLTDPNLSQSRLECYDFGELELSDYGRMVGEVDIWMLDWEEQLMLPVEVKSGYKGVAYGLEQLDRVDDHFEDWDVLKKLLVGKP